MNEHKTFNTITLLVQSFLYYPYKLLNSYKFFIFLMIAWFTIQWNTIERKYEYLLVLEFVSLCLWCLCQWKQNLCSLLNINNPFNLSIWTFFFYFLLWCFIIKDGRNITPNARNQYGNAEWPILKGKNKNTANEKFNVLLLSPPWLILS